MTATTFSSVSSAAIRIFFYDRLKEVRMFDLVSNNKEQERCLGVQGRDWHAPAVVFKVPNLHLENIDSDVLISEQVKEGRVTFLDGNKPTKVPEVKGDHFKRNEAQERGWKAFS